MVFLSRQCPIVIVPGDHDSINPECPYFSFMQHLPNIDFCTRPRLMQESIGSVLLLPHTKDPTQDWDAVTLKAADYIFIHATIRGATAENGYQLDAAFTR